MTEFSTRDSFIVRVYRYDPAKRGKLQGAVERIDGSGSNAPFKDTEELGAILSASLAAPNPKRRNSARAK